MTSHQKSVSFLLGIFVVLICMMAACINMTVKRIESKTTVPLPFSMVKAYDNQNKIIRFQDFETGVICYDRPAVFSCVFVGK